MKSDSKANTILDVGCGTLKHTGAFGIDIRLDSQADVIHDLNEFPYPLPDNQYIYVYCHDIIEHIVDTRSLIHELYRVSAPGAVIEIKTPHFSSWYAYNDPSHVHVFGYFFMDHFVKENSTLPGGKPLFRYLSRRFLFRRGLFTPLISLWAQFFPVNYERRWCFLCPCENIWMKLNVEK